MFRRFASLVLTIVLLVCPFLCRTGACCDAAGCADPTSLEAAHPASCCSVCDLRHASTESASVNGSTPEHKRPCPPLERCADPCLCNGAVLSSTDANALPNCDALLTPLALTEVVVLIDFSVRTAAFMPEPPHPSGREIRHARMSLLI
ncbi:hypothetical protein GC176_25840 [bacterium]|nr:hypothetical protein [bacterium]